MHIYVLRLVDGPLLHHITKGFVRLQLAPGKHLIGVRLRENICHTCAYLSLSLSLSLSLALP